MSARPSTASAGRRAASPTQSQRMYDLWIGSVVAALAVGVLRLGPDLLVRVRYRKRGDELPAQTRYNLPIEVLYTVAAVPGHLGAVLLHRGRADRRQQGLAEPGRHRRGRRVQVELAVQLPRRPGADGQDRSTPSTGTSDYIPVLVAADRTRRSGSRSTAKDVIHSFWVPELLFKRDVFPGNVRNAVRGHHRPGGRATSAAAPSCAAPTTR